MRGEGPAMPGASDQRQRVQSVYSFESGRYATTTGGTRDWWEGGGPEKIIPEQKQCGYRIACTRRRSAEDPRPESGNRQGIIRIGEIGGRGDPHGYRKPEGPAVFSPVRMRPPPSRILQDHTRGGVLFIERAER